ncbi:MAG: response regulator, partial [Gammaproteobacteria bacterium]
FDLVVLDREMPGRDGVDAAAIIAAESGDDAPPLIMLTTFGYQDLMPRAGELGIRNFLPKPVTRSTLYDAVVGIFANRSEAAGPMETTPEQPAPVPAKDDLSLIRGARVLLVEDNEVNQLVTEEMLQQKGFEVDIAGNGLEALERMRTLSDPPHYDLVFLDLQMPRMDGYDCAREIRKLPGCERLPLVALTAEAMQGTRERCLEAGMNDYIAKPLRPAEIFACMLRWIKPPASAADLAALGLVDRLAELLSRDDIAAVGCLRELQDSPGLATDRELARIADLTRSYQFEEALGVLRALRARIAR